ncbi:MAG: hypothetical protein R3E18_02835 [Sphingomonadaceae bacterium]
MSDSNRGERNQALGSGLAVLAAIALVSVIVGVLAYSQGIESERRNEYPPAYAETAKADALRSCAGGEVSAVFECVYEKVEASQSQARAEQDLDAQQGMKFWAAIMAILTLGTMILTGIALWFIKGTLEATVIMAGETQELTAETVKATKAMIRQNEITEAAQRPFIIVQPSISPDRNADFAKPVSFQYVNHGKLPARLIRHHFEMVSKTKRKPAKINFNVKRKGQNFPDGYIVPFGETSREFTFAPEVTTVGGPAFSLNFTKPGPDGMGEHFIWRDSYFVGYVLYGDLGGAYWCRRFCWTCMNGSIELIETSDALNTEFRCNRDGTPYGDSRHHQGG